MVRGYGAELESGFVVLVAEVSEVSGTVPVLVPDEFWEVSDVALPRVVVIERVAE